MPPDGVTRRLHTLNKQGDEHVIDNTETTPRSQRRFERIVLKIRCEDVATLLTWQAQHGAKYSTVERSIVGFIRQGFTTLQTVDPTFRRFRDLDVDEARKYIAAWRADAKVASTTPQTLHKAEERSTM